MTDEIEDVDWQEKLTKANLRIVAAGSPARDQKYGHRGDPEGEIHEVDALYPALGCNVRSDLATGLGASSTENGHLEVDDHHCTTIEGLYAAGDVVTDLHQLSVAFGHAAIAAIRSTPFVFVGNNKFEISGLRMGTRERLDGGKLWICLAPEAGPLKLAALTASALIGRLRQRDLVAFEAIEVEVATRRKHQEVSRDGEVSLLDTPLSYRSRPRALRVIVPPDEAKDAAPV